MTSNENPNKNIEDLKKQLKQEEELLEMLKSTNTDTNRAEASKIEAMIAQTRKSIDEAKHSITFDANSTQKISGDSLDEQLRKEKVGSSGASNEKSSGADPFKVQEKVAGRKNLAKRLLVGVGAIALISGLGYSTKLVYDGKAEVVKLNQDYKTLQVEKDTLVKRDYELYKKIFPQLKDLQGSKLESAVKGIGESIDKAAGMSSEAGALWSRRKYDQAMKMYDQASKTNPLNDRSEYLTKEAELAKRDQEHFKQLYIVQDEDTLEGIAKRARVSVQRIKNANGPKYAVLYQGEIAKGMQLALPVDIELVSE